MAVAGATADADQDISERSSREEQWDKNNAVPLSERGLWVSYGSFSLRPLGAVPRAEESRLSWQVPVPSCTAYSARVTISNPTSVFEFETPDAVSLCTRALVPVLLGDAAWDHLIAGSLPCVSCRGDMTIA